MWIRNALAWHCRHISPEKSMPWGFGNLRKNVELFAPEFQYNISRCRRMYPTRQKINQAMFIILGDTKRMRSSSRQRSNMMLALTTLTLAKNRGCHPTLTESCTSTNPQPLTSRQCITRVVSMCWHPTISQCGGCGQWNWDLALTASPWAGDYLTGMSTLKVSSEEPNQGLRGSKTSMPVSYSEFWRQTLR